MTDRCTSCGTSDFFNHEKLCAYATKPSQATKAHIMTKTMLDEYLGQSGDMFVTISNLENMLKDNTLSRGLLTHAALFSAEKALAALKKLQAVIDA